MAKLVSRDFLLGIPRLTRPEILDSFSLSAEEMLEVEVMLSGSKTYSNVALEKLAYKTTNAGVQHILFDRATLVPIILKNKNLNPKVIPLFLKHLLSFDQGFLPFNSHYALHDLMVHKVVVADVELFKQVWRTALLVSKATFSMSPSAEVCLLPVALEAYSMAEDNAANAMSIETLLFLLSYFSKWDDLTIPRDVRVARKKILETRREEIRVWIKENLHGCDELPLSWVYKVYDLYE